MLKQQTLKKEEEKKQQKKCKVCEEAQQGIKAHEDTKYKNKNEKKKIIIAQIHK